MFGEPGSARNYIYGAMRKDGDFYSFGCAVPVPADACLYHVTCPGCRTDSKVYTNPKGKTYHCECGSSWTV